MIKSMLVVHTSYRTAAQGVESVKKIAHMLKSTDDIMCS